MDKLFIIKIGGNVIDNEDQLALFLDKFSSIRENRILVHGGGKIANRFADRMGISQQMVEGRRITDAETLKLITMVYAGLVNKNIVSGLQSRDCNAIGLSGADGNLITAHKRKIETIDFGLVGDIDSINVDLVEQFIRMQLVPVVAPLTHDHTGQLLNTNADTIAQELASAVSAKFSTVLVFTFEKPGVMRDIEDAESVIPRLDKTEYLKLKSASKIFSGMIPKLDNAFRAIEKGVEKVIIGPANRLEDLLIGKAGTTLVNG